MKDNGVMENYEDIFNRLWEHSENEIVEFKKAERSEELLGFEQ